MNPKETPVQKRTFLQRFAPVVAILVVTAIIAAAVISTVIVIRRDAVKATVPIEAMEDLPGPKHQLSDRSKYQLETMSAGYSHIMATMVIRYEYSKTQNPYVYVWAATPAVKKVLDQVLEDVRKRQNQTTGLSSQEAVDKAAKNPTESGKHLRNSEEAKMGLIKCVPINETLIINQSLRTIGTGICYATIPPFEANPNMAIIMLTDSPLEKFSEIAEMRRILLALQIDIFNRDYQGRETWAHP